MLNKVTCWLKSFQMPFEDRLIETDGHFNGGDMFFYIHHPTGVENDIFVLESAFYGNHTICFNKKFALINVISV